MGPPIFIGGKLLFLGNFRGYFRGLQWGHRFSSVERPVPRNPSLWIVSFNGATDFHRWKEHQPTPRPSRRRAASMGPPIFIGGKRRFPPSRVVPIVCFNGATDFHRWKEGRREHGPGKETRFNGATDFHRWKDPMADGVRYERHRFNGATDFHRWKGRRHRQEMRRGFALQWGHRFSSVESSMSADGWDGVREASMGPPIFIGGKKAL